MYFKNKCPICNHEYDAMEPKCPNCNEINNRNIDATRYPKSIVFPFWKQLLLFFTGWAGFQIIAYLVMYLARLFTSDEAILSAIINFGSYFILGIAMSFILWKDWKKIFNSFKGWRTYVFGLAGLGAIFVFSNFWSIIIQLLQIDVSDNINQSSVVNLVVTYPLLSIIVIGIIGPLCEELAYRAGLFSFLKRINSIFAYVISALIFALIHFDFNSIIVGFETSNWSILINELINLPPYVFAGLTFTFLFEKFGFGCGLFAHILNNVYSIFATLLLNFIEKLSGIS
ncbi:MAG: type II CAAX endopeptidase family protein [Bacillales bacterium]|nr:type II CAAX endopeptidase family protein [Bacillales bacterium]MDY6002981.1 type II CAAX endopeptidase family protein [Bacilli bacterium]